MLAIYTHYKTNVFCFKMYAHDTTEVYYCWRPWWHMTECFSPYFLVLGRSSTSSCTKPSWIWWAPRTIRRCSSLLTTTGQSQEAWPVPPRVWSPLCNHGNQPPLLRQIPQQLKGLLHRWMWSILGASALYIYLVLVMAMTNTLQNGLVFSPVNFLLTLSRFSHSLAFISIKKGTQHFYRELFC